MRSSGIKSRAEQEIIYLETGGDNMHNTLCLCYNNITLELGSGPD